MPVPESPLYPGFIGDLSRFCDLDVLRKLARIFPASEFPIARLHRRFRTFFDDYLCIPSPSEIAARAASWEPVNRNFDHVAESPDGIEPPLSAEEYLLKIYLSRLQDFADRLETCKDILSANMVSPEIGSTGAKVLLSRRLAVSNDQYALPPDAVHHVLHSVVSIPKASMASKASDAGSAVGECTLIYLEACALTPGDFTHGSASLHHLFRLWWPLLLPFVHRDAILLAGLWPNTDGGMHTISIFDDEERRREIRNWRSQLNIRTSNHSTDGNYVKPSLNWGDTENDLCTAEIDRIWNDLERTLFGRAHYNLSISTHLLDSLISTIRKMQWRARNSWPLSIEGKPETYGTLSLASAFAKDTKPSDEVAQPALDLNRMQTALPGYDAWIQTSNITVVDGLSTSGLVTACATFDQVKVVFDMSCASCSGDATQLSPTRISFEMSYFWRDGPGPILLENHMCIVADVPAVDEKPATRITLIDTKCSARDAGHDHRRWPAIVDLMHELGVRVPHNAPKPETLSPRTRYTPHIGWTPDNFFRWLVAFCCTAFPHVLIQYFDPDLEFGLIDISPVADDGILNVAAYAVWHDPITI
ncbi:uncharacterized protein EV422DRAFT_510143 [Fimicolochytrium jonesii]|uniref:uncharacterized protein n=1 Tax=Fimicolochytrium jonesii TaxID=1396493 RepID=UPI0022FE3106|nr:uncharacterized protein EV422DRAFT_510143 [Fimicolochytrium jonesii]KAI8816019.1 hypothetical protein EV422DRAFT_510143 [Fimicolochytrium jonesii]